MEQFKDFFILASPQLIMVAVIYVLVLAVIFLDLWSGVRKAKKRGEYRSSAGLRRTIDKICRYFNMLLIVTIIDLVQMIAIWSLNTQSETMLPTLPVFTFVGAIFACFIELKSVWEKNDKKEKAKMQETAKLIQTLLKDKDTKEHLSSLLAYLDENKKSSTKNISNNENID
ncbi:MAG: phage holin family protein [Bacteroidales bacterium]|nr:phage holin family protein [Bacteroidales bacterium]